MSDASPMDEDWSLLQTFFPDRWRELARETRALKGLRKDKGESEFLRTLLLHLACGYSLRETATRAREAKLADLSDVAVLKRLRKSKDWLQAMCVRLFATQAPGRPELPPGLRLVDATLVKELGPTGSTWRIHYALRWPELTCDFFQVTATQGAGTGESLTPFPVQPGEHLLADRGYSNYASARHVTEKGAWLTVRLNPQSVRLMEG
jgi:hypothetical protein